MTTLNSNPPCMIDDDMYDALSKIQWHYGKGRAKVYFMGWWGGTYKYLHRYIYELRYGPIPLHLEIDHKDRNPLNQTSDNLRAVTRSENHGNKKLNSNNTSGYKGVCFYKAYGKYAAATKREGQRLFLGYFESKHEAALAVNKAYKQYYPNCPLPNQIPENELKRIAARITL